MNISSNFSIAQSIPQTQKATAAKTSNQAAVSTSNDAQKAYSVELGTKPIQTGTYSRSMTTTSRAS